MRGLAREDEPHGSAGESRVSLFLFSFLFSRIGDLNDVVFCSQGVASVGGERQFAGSDDDDHRGGDAGDQGRGSTTARAGLRPLSNSGVR